MVCERKIPPKVYLWLKFRLSFGVLFFTGSVFTLLHLKPSEQSYDPLISAAAHCGIPLKVSLHRVLFVTVNSHRHSLFDTEIVAEASSIVVLLPLSALLYHTNPRESSHFTYWLYPFIEGCFT